MNRKASTIILLVIMATIGVLALESSGKINLGLINPAAKEGELLVEAEVEQIKAKIVASNSKLTLMNVWATWCAPCKEEFPSLMKLRENYKDRGLNLVFVSADPESEVPQVKEFLAEQRVDFETYRKTDEDEDFINSISKDWSGALPATALYSAAGDQIDFWVGDLSYEEFEEKIKPHLSDTEE